ncbi:MSMEG_0570 family nitrogen starvation response protein [Epibacterium ulvae]|uniref:MSMEG_0570 family nitrogen starvation response protein n=1 Tax=Epibacterium ulvae TaxID=1156985 RepID=UPI0024912EAA|nr:MSMEG_0570 family nitrogen starvation response protein [Epibacterium ulvae]
MPETRFSVRWPDGEVEHCYSPSTVVRQYLTADTTYALDEFVSLCREALDSASLRVKAKYGSRCGHADAQLSQIERKASTYSASADVTCLSIT